MAAGQRAWSATRLYPTHLTYPTNLTYPTDLTNLPYPTCLPYLAGLTATYLICPTISPALDMSVAPAGKPFFRKR